MAGHSKWANIKHKKAATDAKRGKIFSVLIRELTVAAKLGGPEPDDNPRLRTAVDKALSANMNKDTIERAIQRGAGGLEGENLEEVSFEGYGPGGIAIMVESMTDNNNRTVADVRSYFSKCEGSLGVNGSLEYLFERKGVFIIKLDGISEDIEELEMELIDAGLEELEVYEGESTVFCDYKDFSNMQSKLESLNIDYCELGFRFAKNSGFKGSCAFTTEKFINSLKIPSKLKIAITSLKS